MHIKKSLVPILFVVLLVLVLLAGLAFFLFVRSSQRMEKTFTYSDEAFGNPLMGYAPSAGDETVGEDVSLLYMDITWRELEPEEGVFDWQSIEEENQLDRWRAEGKHIVLRFLCDLPGEEDHRDIPDWLYEKTGGSGASYDIPYGKGYCPDYSDPVFLAYHQKAIEALGERYGQDTLVSYVELGSLGHWGEWHIYSSEDLPQMPSQAVRAEYVKQWVDAFPLAKLLMRRPFAEAQEYGLGLYNDMAGHPESTEEWLDWIENGGVYDQTGEEGALVPMAEAWKTAPVGGEFTSSLEMEEMLVSELSRTVELLRDSHTTFLGPKIAEETFPEGYDAVLQNMGYRIWVSDMNLSARLTGGIQVDLTWQNSGVAPLYAAWPVYLQVLDRDGNLQEQVRVELSLDQLLPDAPMQITTTVHTIQRWKDLDQYTLQLVIVDPMTGNASVHFANAEANPENRTLFLH